MNCILIQVLNGVTSGPSPVPGLLPPSHPTPSEVGDGRNGGSGRVTLLPLGGSGGGVRAAELPLGSNDAQPGEGEGGLSPFPLVIPPSQPTPPQVGEGRSGFRQSATVAGLIGMQAKQANAQASDRLTLLRRAGDAEHAQSSIQHKLRIIDVRYSSL